jgi:endo-1,3-1,4-beta-glycanase ExoK
MLSGSAGRVARTAYLGLRYLQQAAAFAAMSLALALGVATMLAPAVLFVGVALSVLNRPSAPPATPQEQAEVLPDYVAFIDRFSTLDDERWTFSDGWDNGYWNWSDWRRSSLHPSPEGLAIVMRPNPPGASKPYAGGELQSKELFRYGYYEVRMRVPRGDGIVVGFFTFTRPEGRDSQQEIDIEFVGSRTNHIEFGYFLGRHERHERLRLPFDATDDFHTYAFEWTPQGIRWYVDNRLMLEMHDERARRLTSPERLYLSLSASRIAEWTGELDRSLAPWRLDVTCVAQAREYRGVSLCPA